MSNTVRPLAKQRPRNPEAQALASEIRVMVARVTLANGWDLTRLCLEINLSETQLRAARKGECDPRASSFRKLQKLYAEVMTRRTGT